MAIIVKNSQTGQYGVIDETGNFIKGATVAQHPDGQIGAFDSEGNNLAIFNPKTNLQIPIETPPTGNSQTDKSLAIVNSNDSNADKIAAMSPKNLGNTDRTLGDGKGFIQSAYEAGIKPLQDQAQEFLDRGDLGIHQLRVLATGLASQTNNFVEQFLHHGNHPNDVATAIPLIGPVIQKMQEQMQSGDYRGALGTLAGSAAPFATDQIGEGLTAGKQLIKNAPDAVASSVLPRVFPRSGDVLPADTAAARVDQSARSVGQLTGSKAAQFLEQTHGGKVAADLADTQRAATAQKLDSLKKTIMPNGIPDNINTLTQKKLSENYFDTEANKNQKYTDFQQNHVEPNTWDIATEVPNPDYKELPPAKSATEFEARKAQGSISPTMMVKTQVHGPIVLDKTLPLAEELKTKLDAFKNGPEYQVLPPISQVKFNTISSTVNNLINKSATVINGQIHELPIAAYDKVKQIRTDIGNKLSGLDQFGLGDKMLSDIKNSLGDDIQTSVKNYWGNGSKASADLQDANSTHAAFKTLFDDSLKGKLFKDNPNLSKSGGNMADPSTLLNGVAESPEVAKQFIDALGPTNTHLAKGAVMGKLLEGASDVANDSFSPDKVINQMQSSGYKELFTNAERTQAEFALRQFRTMDPSILSSKAGYFGRLAFHLGLPAAGLAIGHFSGGAIAGAVAGASLEIGMGQFARRILLNPKYARIAAQLPYAKAGSAKAGLLQTQLLKALAGTSVGVVLNNGSKVPAQVNGDGKVIEH